MNSFLKINANMFCIGVLLLYICSTKLTIMNYDESLENDRNLLEGIKSDYKEPKTVFAVVASYNKDNPLEELNLTFSSYYRFEGENALEADTLTAALAQDDDIKSFSLCSIPENLFDKKNINACSGHLTIIETNLCH